MNSTLHSKITKIWFILKPFFIVLLVIFVAFLILAVLLLVGFDHEQKRKFEQYEARIQPAYSEIQKNTRIALY